VPVCLPGGHRRAAGTGAARGRHHRGARRPDPVPVQAAGRADRAPMTFRRPCGLYRWTSTAAAPHRPQPGTATFP